MKPSDLEPHRNEVRPRQPLVSVVVPVFNEEDVLERLVDEIAGVLTTAGLSFDIVFVNDGSTDDSSRVLDQMAARDHRIRVLHLSRNFGQQAALQAGLVHARGDVIVVMDADLQDLPEGIVRFIDRWRQGYDVVYAVRVDRKEARWKRFLFAAFYRFIHVVSQPPIPLDAGNFCLIDRRVAALVVQLTDRSRHFPGLRSWVGFKQIGVSVERGERYDQRPRVSLFSLWRLAKDAIFSFSRVPLTIFYLLAFIAVTTFVGLSAFTLYHKLLTGQAIPGWTSLIMTACFFGAFNALGIAILGEYIVRIYDQARARPLFVVDRGVNIAALRQESARYDVQDEPPAR